MLLKLILLGVTITAGRLCQPSLSLQCYPWRAKQPTNERHVGCWQAELAASAARGLGGANFEIPVSPRGAEPGFFFCFSLFFILFFRLGCPAWANFILCPHSCPSWAGYLARLGGLVAISQVGFALITQGVATRAFLRWNPVYLLKIEFSQKTQT